MMKAKLIGILLWSGCATMLWAQTPQTHVADSIQLKEVEVTAARELRRPEGRLIYPSDLQKKSSVNGYDLLNKLTLPGIRINVALHTIEALRSDETVQIRINGALASKDDLLAIDPKLIKSVDFIDNPGLRYGRDVTYVVLISTARGPEGYAAGVDLTNTLTSMNGDNMAFGKLNHGKSQIALVYNFHHQHFKGSRYNEEADYLLHDGTHRIIGRNDTYNRKHELTHSLQLQYSMADSASYMFQATLSADRDRLHRDGRYELTTDGMLSGEVTTRAHEKRLTPVLDLYYSRHWSRHQWLTANAVGTMISSKDHHFDDEMENYDYQVQGHTWSVIGEVIYENRLKPFTLTAGLQTHYKHIHNTYSGDASSSNVMKRHGLYGYGELKGKLGPIGYVAGIGLSNEYYRQEDHDYSFWLLRPKATLTYSWARPWQLRYSFELSQHVSQVAMISNTMIRQNSMEWKVGNPDIRPSRVMEHRFTAAYTAPRLQSSIKVMYRRDPHANLAQYTRNDDDIFYYRQVNQHGIEMIYSMLDTRYEALPGKLYLTLQGGINRFFNHGNDYEHALTTYNYGGSIQAYLGRWTITGNMDNGWNFMEGETKSYSTLATYLTCSYRWGACEVSLYWQHPLQHNPQMMHAELVSAQIHKAMSMYSSDLGNMLTLNFSWKLNHGKKFHDIEKTLKNGDKQTGILQ